MAGRKPIGERAMTAAERKARSRALSLGGVVGHLDQAHAALDALRAALRVHLVGEAAEAFAEVELHLSLARSYVPNS